MAHARLVPSKPVEQNIELTISLKEAEFLQRLFNGNVCVEGGMFGEDTPDWTIYNALKGFGFTTRALPALDNNERLRISKDWETQ